MTYNGVKFYSANDFSCGPNLQKAETILQNFKSQTVYNDINQVIELYNIYRFFQEQIYLSSWQANIIEKYKGISEQFITVIALFFANIDQNNIFDKIADLDFDYMDDF